MSYWDFVDCKPHVFGKGQPDPVIRLPEAQFLYEDSIIQLYGHFSSEGLKTRVMIVNANAEDDSVQEIVGFGE